MPAITNTILEGYFAVGKTYGDQKYFISTIFERIHRYEELNAKSWNFSVFKSPVWNEPKETKECDNGYHADIFPIS